MSGVNYASRHQEASAGAGWIAQHNLAIPFSRTTCGANGTNLPPKWLYQDRRWSLIYETVVLIKQIHGPTYTTVRIEQLSIYKNAIHSW